MKIKNNSIILKIHKSCCKIALKYLLLISSLIILFTLYQVFFVVPIDYQQGEAAKMMYLHVPASWLAILIYLFMGSISIIGLIWKIPMCFLYARSAATVGMMFCAISLFTGSIWGRMIWGAWWVWDARLTSMLILFITYLGYILLVNCFNNEEKGERVGGLILILGLVNIPIIKFSVDWWNTLHQKSSIIRMEGIAIDSSMFISLPLMFLGFLLLTISLIFLQADNKFLNKKLQQRILENSRKLK